ncbi:AraC family transcriptional regulator [Delftia acidovorans]
MTTLLRSACLDGYVPLALSAGLAPYQMLEAAGIRRAWLHKRDIKFSTDAFRKLISASVEASGWSDFGLRLAATRSISVLGPLALLIREQPSARDALETIAQHLSLHAEALHLRIEDQHAQTMLMIDFNSSSGRETCAAAVDLTIGALYRMIAQLLPQVQQPLSVHFVHAAPSATHPYREFFGMPPVFHSSFDGLVYPSSVLDRRRPADPVMESYARELVTQLYTNRNQHNFADQVTNLIYGLLPMGTCSLQHIAEMLGLSVRTVRRHLNSEGTAYEVLLNQIRRSLATRYVGAKDRSFSEISLMLGFSGGSRFSHWFRQEFGCSATAWRQQISRVRSP